MKEKSRSGEQGNPPAITGRPHMRSSEASLRRSRADSATSVPGPAAGKPALPEASRTSAAAGHGPKDRGKSAGGSPMAEATSGDVFPSPADRSPQQNALTGSERGSKPHDEESLTGVAAIGDRSGHETSQVADEALPAADQTSERDQSYQVRLAGEIGRRLSAREAVTVNICDGDDEETVIATSGIDSTDGDTHFVLFSSINIKDDRVQLGTERARLRWLHEPTMTAGEIILKEYPFSGFSITSDKTDFTDGDAVAIIPGKEILGGTDYIEKWNETGGNVYVPSGESMTDAERENLLAQIQNGVHSPVLTDAIVNEFEFFGGRRINYETEDFQLKDTMDRQTASDILQAVIETDERTFSGPVDTIRGHTMEDIQTAMTLYAKLLLLEHDKKEFDSYVGIEDNTLEKDTPHGQMRFQNLRLRNGRLFSLEMNSDTRKVLSLFSFNGDQGEAKFYDTQDPAGAARLQSDSLLAAFSIIPEVAQRLRDREYTFEDFQRDFRGLRWMAANLKHWTETTDNGAKRVILPEDLDAMSLQDGYQITSGSERELFPQRELPVAAEADDGRKPVRMVFGDHTESDIQNLHRFGKEIEDMLATRSDGQVAVVVEDAYMTRDKAKRITELVNTGWLPTEAYAVTTRAFSQYVYWQLPEYTTHARLDFMNNVSREFVQKWLSREDCGYKKVDPFTRAQYQILDEIAGNENNKGRMLLLPEQNNVPLSSEYVDQVFHMYIKEAAKGNFYSDGFKAEFDRFNGTLVSGREVDIRRRMQDTLERDTVFGLVSHLGPGHAGLKDDFQESDHLSVKAVFSNADDGEDFVLNPIQAATNRHRKVEFGRRDNLASKEAKILLVQTVIWSLYTASVKKSDKIDMTEQQATRKIMEIIGDYTIDDANAFERDVQDPEIGIKGAMAKVMRSSKQE